MERKLLIEVLKLLRTMGTLKMLDTDKVTTMITTKISRIHRRNKSY